MRGKIEPRSTDAFTSQQVIFDFAPTWARFAIGDVSELDNEVYVWDLDLAKIHVEKNFVEIPLWRKFKTMDVAIAAACMQADSPGPNQLTQLRKN